MAAQAIAVETAQVALRTAAADYYHCIEIVGTVGNRTQSLDDRIFSAGTLHKGIEKRNFKPVRTVGKFVTEILITGGIAGRNDRQTLNHHGQLQFTVHFEYAVGLQPCNGLLPLPLHVPERIGRINVGNLQRKAVQLVIRYHHLHQHLQSGREHLPRQLTKIRFQHRISIAPDDGVRLGLRNVIRTTLLDQLEITMPRIVHFQFADLGRHPIRQRMRLVDARLDHRLQPAERYGVRLRHRQLFTR